MAPDRPEKEKPIEEAEPSDPKGDFCYVKGPKKASPNTEITLTLFTNAPINSIITWSSKGADISPPSEQGTKNATFLLGPHFKGGKITALVDGYEGCHSTHAIELKEKDPTYGTSMRLIVDPVANNEGVVLVSDTGHMSCDTELLYLMCFLDADEPLPDTLGEGYRRNWFGGVVLLSGAFRKNINTLEDANEHCSDLLGDTWRVARLNEARSSGLFYAFDGNYNEITDNSRGLVDAGTNKSTCWTH